MNSPCSRKISSAISETPIAAAARRYTPSSKRGLEDDELEIRRDLRDPGAGGSAGGLHQCCGTSSQPCAHANARNRGTIGAGRRAFPAYPAVVDGKPDSGVAWRIGRDRHWLRRHRVVPHERKHRFYDRVADGGAVPDGYARAAGSLALSLLSALLCGLAPALQSTRVDLVNGLKSADVDVPGRKRLWGRNVLVVAQVSMSLMLLTASFLMARGFQHELDGGHRFRERPSADGRVSIRVWCSTTQLRRSSSTSCWPNACGKRPECRAWL